MRKKALAKGAELSCATALERETVTDSKGIKGKKIGIIHGVGWGGFLNGLIEHFRKNNNQVRVPESNWASEYEDIIKWADVVWLEWGSEQAIHVTNKVEALKSKPTICRIHGYELFFGFLPQINWSAVSHAVFVSDFMIELARRVCPALFKQTKIGILPNGVDLDRFPFKNNGPGLNLAVVGDVAEKKNPALWIEIACRLREINPGFTIHVAGEIKEAKIHLYLDHIIGSLNLSKNMVYHGYVKDIPGWFRKQKINYLLSTSYFESFGYSIAEAMAMGCKPLVFHYPGADRIWPSTCLFRNTDELIALIQNNNDYDSKAFRQFVTERYSLAHQLAVLDQLTDSII